MELAEPFRKVERVIVFFKYTFGIPRGSGSCCLGFLLFVFWRGGILQQLPKVNLDIGIQIGSKQSFPGMHNKIQQDQGAYIEHCTSIVPYLCVIVLDKLY